MSPAVRAALPPLVVALVLLALGRTTGAALAVVAAGLLAQAALLVPDQLAAVTHAVAHGVGRVVTVVLLAPVYFLVFVPIGLVASALGTEPVGGRGSWARRPARARDRRIFGDDRHPSAGRTWRSAVALIAVGAVIAWGLPALLDRDPEGPEVPGAIGTTSFNALDSPALADSDWVEAASTEFAEATAGQTYTSYVVHSLRDYEGRYVNVTDRQRASYLAEAESGVEPLEVWFFGGSTMFGYSAQRDEHTIPSEVVRLAEAEGRPIVARNYGAPGYVNFQETVLMAQLLATGARPDLIVFYDGINDTAVLLQQAFGGIGVAGDPADIVAFSYRNLLAGQLTGTAESPVPLGPTVDVGRPPRVDALVGGLLDVYGQGLELADALSAQYEVPVLHYWQPTLFTKEPLVDGEVELIEALGMDQFRFDAFARISRAVLDDLPPGVIDLTAAYAGESAPVLTDQVHTNELGAALIAAGMWPTIQDRLAAIDGGTLPP